MVNTTIHSSASGRVSKRRSARKSTKRTERGIQCHLKITPRESTGDHTDCELCSGTTQRFRFPCDGHPYASESGDHTFRADDDGTILRLTYESKDSTEEPWKFISIPRRHFKNVSVEDHIFDIRWIDKNPTVTFPFSNIGSVITEYIRELERNDAEGGERAKNDPYLISQRKFIDAWLSSDMFGSKRRKYHAAGSS